MHLGKPRRGRLRRISDHFAVDQHRFHSSVESAGLKSLDRQRPLRPRLLDDLEIVNPLERCVGQFEVADANQLPGGPTVGRGDFFPRFGGDRRWKFLQRADVGLELLGARDFPHANRAVGELHFDHRSRPECANPLDHHKRQQPDDEHERRWPVRRRLAKAAARHARRESNARSCVGECAGQLDSPQARCQQPAWAAPMLLSVELRR